ncbi:squalene--hopene cyclase [Bacillus sp. CGMCC 1.16607]|uniref:squalene--hopene cyclase n=1 Tax=Bacillus sp. CGMCC 1.16607 TaxID=3351842 RepID=UPI003629B6B9
MTLNPIPEMNRIIDRLKKDQLDDGTWDYPFETGVSTDSYMIILLRSLQINDEQLIEELAERIMSKQEKNGSWKLFYDEGNGNITSTMEAYYALLYSGYYPKTDPKLRAARKFILANGGIEKSHMLLKIMLAITGQLPWPNFFPIPIEIILLPNSFPINFFDFSVYGRANISPILILENKKYSIRTNKSPDLSDLFVNRGSEWNEEYSMWMRSSKWGNILSIIKSGIKGLLGVPSENKILAIERLKQYMLDRIEPDGTFYSYFSSTFLMVYALLALGYPKDHPTIKNAISGIKSMKCEINGKTHIQYTTATVWNTSLINYALQAAGVSETDPMVRKANQYLLSRQHYKFGDWAYHNPQHLPGGWGFSNVNTINPDIDDTTASMRSIVSTVNKNPNSHQAWDRGIKWLFSMQNDDGGWSAFEKNVNKKIYKIIPIQGIKYLIADPSSPDLTGRTIEFFGRYTKLSKNDKAIKHGVNWLLSQQEDDGSWYGRWGICYIYGTWAAVTGLIAAGIEPNHLAIRRSVTWLKSIQNRDGGWGESCKSDSENRYIPLGKSTVTHTAWALDALISASEKSTPEIEAGIKFLFKPFEKEDWEANYPTGQGMAGGFYIHYHSYQYIFPLLALAHYKKKFFKIE